MFSFDFFFDLSCFWRSMWASFIKARLELWGLSCLQAERRDLLSRGLDRRYHTRGRGWIFLSQVWTACGIQQKLFFWRFNIDKMFPLPEGKSWIILHNFLLHRRFVVRQESCMQQDVTLPRHPPQVLCGFDDKEFPMPDAWRESCQMCLVFGEQGRFRELLLFFDFLILILSNSASLILHENSWPTYGLRSEFRTRELCEGVLGMENLF